MDWLGVLVACGIVSVRGHCDLEMNFWNIIHVYVGDALSFLFTKPSMCPEKSGTDKQSSLREQG